MSIAPSSLHGFDWLAAHLPGRGDALAHNMIRRTSAQRVCPLHLAQRERSHSQCFHTCSRQCVFNMSMLWNKCQSPSPLIATPFPRAANELFNVSVGFLCPPVVRLYY